MGIQLRSRYRLCYELAFYVGITILNQRIILKDDIEFVTEFPCLLGQPVQSKYIQLLKKCQ